MKEENWFTFDDSRGIVEINLNKEKGLNDYCYFCDFSETKPHQHHIIRKIDGGTNRKNNLLPLCPNHHFLIHNRIYILGFNPKLGYYFLKHKETGNIIPPTKRQRIKKRKLPLTSIKGNNLIIEGNLNTKATLKIKK